MTHHRIYRDASDPDLRAPSSGGDAPGKSTLTSRHSTGRGGNVIVLRVDSPEAARELATAFGPRDPNGVAADADAAVARAASSSGAPLDGVLRQRFEGSLGADLGGVRLHTGAASAEAAEAVRARAYTVGSDVHFGAGQYDPSSTDGQFLIAHEVAHTVQQRGGAPTRQHKLEVSSPGDASEVEADRAAARMVLGESAEVGGGGGVAREADVALQSPEGGDLGPEPAAAPRRQNKKMFKLLVDGQGEMPDLVLDKYKVGGKQFDLFLSQRDGYTEIFTSLWYDLTGANAGPIDSVGVFESRHKALKPEHINNSGPGFVQGNINCLGDFGDGYTDALPFTVRPSSVSSGPTEVASVLGINDLTAQVGPSFEPAKPEARPNVAQASKAYANMFSVTDTVSHGYTITNGIERSTSGEIGATKGALAAKLSHAFKESKTDATSVADSIATAVTAIETTTLTPSFYIPANTDFWYAWMPQVNLRTFEIQLVQSNEQGVVTGKDVKKVYVHHKVATGGLTKYEARTRAELLAKIAADDRSAVQPTRRTSTDAPTPDGTLPTDDPAPADDLPW
jgi:hypothetical protein